MSSLGSSLGESSTCVFAASDHAKGLVTVLAAMLALGVLGPVAAKAQTTYQFETLYKFQGGSAGGATPMGGIRNTSGTTYVATYFGGDTSCYSTGCGMFYSLDSSGAWTPVYTFTGTDGAMPFSSLALDSAGNIYGTTEYGGDFSCSANGCGVVYKLNPTAKQIKVLYQFPGGSDGIGGSPGSVVIDSAGNLYGSADTGGGNGLIFEIDKTTGNESVLYAFTGGSDGGGSVLAIGVDSGGMLYGTTRGGGKYGAGTVFKINTNTKAENVVYNFTGGSDGGSPRGAQLELEPESLIGVTKEGGSGYGVIYQVNIATGDETVLYTFEGGADGSLPGGFAVDEQGDLFGVTKQGGNTACSNGCGTVFKLTSGKKTILHNFSGSDGDEPGGVLLDSLGNIYGVTTEGGNTPTACNNMLGTGSNGCGTVFELAIQSEVQAVTTTTVTPSPATVALGGVTTLTAKVSSATAGTITGSVTFKRGSTTLGTAPLSGGKAILSNAPVTAAKGFVVGSNTVTAAYGGSTSFAPSSGNTTVNVTEAGMAAPVFSPAGGTYESVESVKITDSTTNATIHYAINGTVSSTSPTYSGPITVSASETIEAMAVAGSSESAKATATYTIVGSPYALAAPATLVTASSATLNAMVSSQGLSGGSYQFQYATSAAALSTNPVTTARVSLGPASTPALVDKSITGLSPATTYYYRVVVSTTGGIASGEVLSFKTP